MRAVIKEKKERALGTKLFLKAERCDSPKCAMVRRPQRPGPHGTKRHNVSEYGRQLNEKQKLQIIYGLTNRQLGSLFSTHESKVAVLGILERRLDRVVFLAGFAKSPRIARQLVSHGHILVNGKKVTIQSFLVKKGNVVSVRPESRTRKLFEGLSEGLQRRQPPAWLALDADAWLVRAEGEPQVETAELPFDIGLVGEFYAR